MDDILWQDETNLRLNKLETEQEKKEQLLDMLVRNVNELEKFRKQFGNGNGIIPKIIKGLSSKFDKMFADFKKEREERFKDYMEEIKATIALIPCSKLLGDGCHYKLIEKDEPIPKGYKEVKG